ncbi:hypothetical protein [Streptomyces demainii]|uniref:Uncharacterized protein n=1 Tax=Streptomyces demainii TaxID=588122 RepID=A0ABT9KQV6_9ACTN|nr:hypothetical protein [Streptomyces demainii]MDP9610828.1 hypothetical protein [Streptomyces demainii]
MNVLVRVLAWQGSWIVVLLVGGCVGLVLAAVVFAVGFAGVAAGADQGAVQQHVLAAASGDLSSGRGPGAGALAASKAITSSASPWAPLIPANFVEPAPVVMLPIGIELSVPLVSAWL